VEALAALPALGQLSAWDAGLPDDAGERLAEAHPGLIASLGRDGGREPLELEPEVVFGEPSALSPVNVVCPVSGGPVDPAFSIVHDGQVLGFCCNECPTTFWDDPSAFPVTAAE
jgi:YHS domain-containing protein